MPALTRRRDPDAHQETWLVFYGDVHAGTIMRCVGNPNAAPQWQWGCGFIRISAWGMYDWHRGELRGGALGLCGRLARIPVEPDGSRFSSVARSARSDRGEISALRSRRAHAARWAGQWLIATPDVIPGGRTESPGDATTVGCQPEV
jgi:hypothetical protein